ncbi:MAG: peptidoglycan-binding protein [Nannocystaceae bacterium]
MIRSDMSWAVPIAPIPAPAPVWPIMGDTAPKLWPQSLGFQRPFACTDDACVTHWHPAVDLRCENRAGIRACEDFEVLTVRTWSLGTWYVFGRNEASMVTYGGLRSDSVPSVGTFIKQGDKLGERGEGYSGLHFELYELDPNRATPSQWKRGEDPPEGLLNPVNYLEVAGGLVPSMATAPQRLAALKELGVYAGKVLGPWSDAADTALIAAQRMLGLEPDGIWGPQTEDAVRRATVVKGKQPEPGTKTRGLSLVTPRNVMLAGAVGLAAVIGRKYYVQTR